MDIASALKNEIFRPLTTIVVPGAFAIGPFVLVLAHYVPPIQVFWGSNPNAFIAILSVAILAAGLVLEDVGSCLEVIWDASLKTKHPERGQAWQSYLQLKLNDEYVGQRYLRTIFIRFKFELSMAPALLVFLGGLLWANTIYGMWKACGMAFISIIVLGISAFLFWESYDSAFLLGSIHKSLVEALKADSVVPAPKA